MRKDLGFIITIVGILASSLTVATAENWPGWRGPRGDGTCLEQEVPTHWDPAGASWKVELPGKGHASPIVWGDRVCTVTALPEAGQRLLLCLDRTSGERRWQSEPVAPRENMGYVYGPTLVAYDDVVLFADGRGQRKIHAVSKADGKLLWQAPHYAAGHAGSAEDLMVEAFTPTIGERKVVSTFGLGGKLGFTRVEHEQQKDGRRCQ